jgi:uncharacterized protein YoxC
MNEIPSYWFVMSAIFYGFGILMFLALIFLAFKMVQFLNNIQPSIANIATKVEGVTQTVESLSHKVEGITTKVEGIADTVKGIADSAKGVADSARGTVQNVGNQATGLVSNLTNTAENTIRKAEGSKILSYIMMGLQVFQAIQQMREHKNGQVDKNGSPAGTLPVRRGVEQPGSSSGS